MADGVRARFDADLGLSVTGVAGPDRRHRPRSPSACVYLGLATADGRRSPAGSTSAPSSPATSSSGRSAKMALNWVRLALLAWPGRS